MKKTIKPFVIFLLTAALVCIPLGSSALAEEYFESKEPSGGEMIYDAVVIRPIGFVATLVGTVMYIVSAPFSSSGDNHENAQKKLMDEPARFTFQRPLGEF